MKTQRILAALILLLFAPLAPRVARADEYDAPGGYYFGTSGLTSTTLKNKLHDIIDNHNSMSYDAARTSLQYTDATLGQPGYMTTVYDRTPLNVAAINPNGNPSGWDSGATWNREHTWPRSRGIDDNGPDDSDLHLLRPAITANNGQRADHNFGGAYGTNVDGGRITINGNFFWYPGNEEAGPVARQMFYGAVRYAGGESQTLDLELSNGFVANPSGANDAPPQLGDLARLIEWNYQVPPDQLERQRNQVIYAGYTIKGGNPLDPDDHRNLQGNRNPFTDHPEWVWSIFVDQANDTQITITGTTPVSGASTKNVDLGRIFTGAAVPAGQTFTLNKSGMDGTYYEVLTSTKATSNVTGHLNNFAMNTGGTKQITVGLSPDPLVTSTATAGLQAGTVTIDNLDVTGLGCGGCGNNDGNDVFNISLTVLDHATPSFASGSLLTSLPINLGTITSAEAAKSQTFDVFNRLATAGFTASMDFDSLTASGDTAALTTNAGSFVNSLVLAGGAGQTMSATLNPSAVGTFSATYTLNFSDENITGAQNKQIMLTLSGIVIQAGDYNRDGVVDSADYVVWRKTNGTSTTARNGADGNGDTFIDENDFLVWQQNYGKVVPMGSGGTSTVPEPATAALVLLALCALTKSRHARLSAK